MKDQSDSIPKNAQSAQFDKYIVNKLLCALHECVSVSATSALAMQQGSTDSDDLFAGEGFGDTLIEVIAQSADRGLDALNELEEALGVSCSFPDLTPADRAR